MPFPGHESVITGLTENLGEGHALIIQITLIGVILQGTGNFGCFRHVPDSGLVRVQTGHQTGPGRAASSVIVEPFELKPLRGQPVDVGGFYLSAVAADVREPHVIDQNDDDVGTGWGGGGRQGLKEEGGEAYPDW